MEQKKTYPYEGEMFKPSEQKFEEVIIFIHYYGGQKKNLKKHIQFINDLGFKAFAFNLSPQPFTGSFSIIKNPRFYFSKLEKRWKREILEVIHLIPNKKILFGFSFSCNIISLMLPQFPKIQAAIFDGGPFADLFKNPWLYLSYQERIHNIFLRMMAFLCWILLFNFLTLKFKIKKSLSKLQKGFPILSFQGLSDKLVPSFCVDRILKHQTHLDITSVHLKKTEHLQGIKSQPEIYKKQLQLFLSRVATPL